MLRNEEKMTQKLDRRVVRTRRMLADALMALIVERGYDNVNIADITERADLRRATFYLHYRDKEELLQDALQAGFDDLRARMDVVLRSDLLAGKTRVEAFLITFRHVEAHHQLYKTILTSQGAASIARHVRAYLAGLILRALEETGVDDTPVPPEVIAHYLAGAEVALITWWLENDRPYAAETMAAMAHRLSVGGALAALGDHAPEIVWD
jgi:AcrR family transcriptional regulator